MPDNNFVGMVGEQCADVYNTVMPQTQSGCGPCDTMMDVNNRRIALPGAWAEFFVLWEIEAINPATTAKMTTVLRSVGHVGIGDSGAAVQQAVGASVVLDPSYTSLYAGGYFYCDYDFLIHCVGYEPLGPVFVGRANASGPNNYLVTGPLSADGVDPEVGIPGYWDEIQEQITRAILMSFWTEFQIDTENQLTWLGLPPDLAPAGLSTNGQIAPANGVSVVGNMNCYRVCFRARGNLNNNSNCKKFVTNFLRSPSMTPNLIIPGGISIDGTLSEGRPLVFAQAIRVWFSGCPAVPCCYDNPCYYPGQEFPQGYPQSQSGGPAAPAVAPAGGFRR